MMACKAFYTPSTKPYEAHHSTQYLNSCSFPARLMPSSFRSQRPLSISASKSKPAAFGKKKKKKVEDDPWESLFRQLEKDLGTDAEESGEKEITEEDIANFERELDIVVEEVANASTIDTTNELDDTSRAHSKDTTKDDEESDNDDKEGIKAKRVNGNEGANDDVEDEDNGEDSDYFSDDDLEEPRKVPLQLWQLRKLAAAAELGRRKVHVKNLAAELQLDRDDVLFFLKNPPPELLMAAREMEEERGEDDEPVSEEEDVSPDNDETNDSLVQKDPDAVSSINDDQESHEVKRRTFGPRDWIKGKRIKKVNLATLQLVYKRTKWPSNTMIESVVQATHLPRTRVLEWFEEERAKSGTREPPRQSATSRKSWKRPVTHSFERLL